MSRKTLYQSKEDGQIKFVVDEVIEGEFECAREELLTQVDRKEFALVRGRLLVLGQDVFLVAVVLSSWFDLL